VFEVSDFNLELVYTNHDGRMAMLDIHFPATFKNRTYGATLSSFDSTCFSDAVKVVFVHKNQDGQKREAVWNPRAKVLSLDLPSAEYNELWTLLWKQTVPTLHIRLESRGQFALEAIDSARDCK